MAKKPARKSPACAPVAAPKPDNAVALAVERPHNPLLVEPAIHPALRPLYDKMVQVAALSDGMAACYGSMLARVDSLGAPKPHEWPGASPNETRWTNLMNEWSGYYRDWCTAIAQANELAKSPAVCALMDGYERRPLMRWSAQTSQSLDQLAATMHPFQTGGVDGLGFIRCGLPPLPTSFRAKAEAVSKRIGDLAAIASPDHSIVIEPGTWPLFPVTEQDSAAQWYWGECDLIYRTSGDWPKAWMWRYGTLSLGFLKQFTACTDKYDDMKAGQFAGLLAFNQAIGRTLSDSYWKQGRAVRIGDRDGSPIEVLHEVLSDVCLRLWQSITPRIGTSPYERPWDLAASIIGSKPLPGLRQLDVSSLESALVELSKASEHHPMGAVGPQAAPTSTDPEHVRLAWHLTDVLHKVLDGCSYCGWLQLLSHDRHDLTGERKREKLSQDSNPRALADAREAMARGSGSCHAAKRLVTMGACFSVSHALHGGRRAFELNLSVAIDKAREALWFAAQNLMHPEVDLRDAAKILHAVEVEIEDAKRFVKVSMALPPTSEDQRTTSTQSPRLGRGERTERIPIAEPEKHVRVAPAAKAVNLRPDKLLDRLRNAGYPVEGKRRAYKAHIDHIMIVVPEKTKAQLKRWFERLTQQQA